jgi:Nucleotide modification associated domain 1
MQDTIRAFEQIGHQCLVIFEQKTKDYGTSWRVLRLPSLTDQIFIKARRIRSIQEKGEQKIADSLTSEFMGIINYCAIALVQSELPVDTAWELPADRAVQLYRKVFTETMDLLQAKNHDYDEAWRLMRVSSMTDIILMKLLRIKQIEDNQGQTLVSEGVEANYRDIMNYAVFCLILMEKN